MTTPSKNLALAALIVLSGLPAGGAAFANGPEPAKEEAWLIERAAASEPVGEVEKYCTNVVDAARDQRYALQAKELEALQAEVDKRMKLLDDKRAEYEAWMKRREQFIGQATDSVVRIYAGMKADSAAERLAELDPFLAAGILMKLESRKAGVILNEMERKAAASLTSIMVTSARRTDPT